MDEEVAEQIRDDLDLIFPFGGYALTVQAGEPPLRLTWERDVHENMRRFSEEIVRLHGVSFETAIASPETGRV
jgi:hypothetical protein